jgi:peroxiredoxin
VVYKSRGKLLARALAVLLVAALVGQFLHVVLAGESRLPVAPDFALRSEAGRTIRLSEYRGDVVALAFGAHWCGDCDATGKALLRIKRAMGDKGLQVLSVSFDHDTDATAHAAAGDDSAFLVLRDPDGEIGRLYSVNKLPSVVLIDREGQLVSTQTGFQPADEARLASKIRDLLAD